MKRILLASLLMAVVSLPGHIYAAEASCCLKSKCGCQQELCCKDGKCECKKGGCLDRKCCGEGVNTPQKCACVGK